MEGLLSSAGLLERANSGPALSPILPLLEMGAYEELWLQSGAWFKTISERFAADPEALPSDFVSHTTAQMRGNEVIAMLRERGVNRFGVRIHHAGDYPARLRDAEHPVELLYYQGTWELAETRSVAIVGTRKPSEEGIARARRIAREMANANFTVTSGLAAGIDRTAHTAALDAGGNTIAVIGTPLGWAYPTENRELQEQIADRFLLISQVPVLRYSRQNPTSNRFFFPARNITMSALTEATIIVEAGETSGTLTQARAAIQQRRKLFILDSCFSSGLKWPAKYEAQGAIRVRRTEDILDALG